MTPTRAGQSTRENLAAGADLPADADGPLAETAHAVTGAATTIAEAAAGAIEIVGILIILAFGVYALVLAAIRFIKREDAEHTFQDVRHRLGRGILLGLEFLVAADIIHTVAVELSWNTVGVLAVIVAIRTFLSFTLELEITGKWPWQQQHSRDPAAKGDDRRRGPRAPRRSGDTADDF